MKRVCAFGATFFLLCAAPAAAQVYPGEDVTVNPGALGHGYLLYPGGKYGRHVGNLLQPGERIGVIHLHMPAKHAKIARRVRKPSAPPSDVANLSVSPDLAPETPPVAPPSVPRKAKRVATATPPAPAASPPSSPPPNINDMPEDSAARLVGTSVGVPSAQTPGAPARPRAARPAPASVPSDSFVGTVTPVPANAPPPRPRAVRPAPASTPSDSFVGTVTPVPANAPPPRPRRVATAGPAPASSLPPAAAGMRRQSTIAFAPGASSPAVADVTAVHSLAGTLIAALNGGAGKVQLDAYGGPRGDKSSDSHRLSLKRALVIRELLIEDGVPSEKIDVRALGGVDDSGPADRVDVFVHA